MSSDSSSAEFPIERIISACEARIASLDPDYASVGWLLEMCRSAHSSGAKTVRVTVADFAGIARYYR